MSVAHAPRPVSRTARARHIGVALLILASLLDLPIVYGLVKAGAPSITVLYVGLLAMGLGWSAGCLLENRRLAVARAIAILGIAQIALAYDSAVSNAGLQWYLVASAAASLAAIILVRVRT